MKSIKKYLIYAAIAIVIIGIIGVLLKVNSNLRKDNKRQTENLEQITADHQRQLTLKKGEYEHLNAQWKDKVDSIRNEYDIKLKHMKQATVTKVVYRDTGSVKIIYGDPQVIYIDTTSALCSNKVQRIPVLSNDACWGFTGAIISRDTLSKLDITERKFQNSIQILITERRRWIFWKEQEFKAFSDCGDLDITQVDFTK